VLADLKAAAAAETGAPLTARFAYAARRLDLQQARDWFDQRESGSRRQVLDLSVARRRALRPVEPT